MTRTKAELEAALLDDRDDDEACRVYIDCLLMPRTAVIALALTLITGCTPSESKLGERCGFGCETPLTCYQNSCRERGTEGVACDVNVSDSCVGYLACSVNSVCRPHEIARAELAAKEQAKERDLLARSGAEPNRVAATSAEQPVSPDGPGEQVRVSETSSETSAFAACREDERLVGGGCRADVVVLESYPSNHSEKDTVGARWNCSLGEVKGETVFAFALCQQIRGGGDLDGAKVRSGE